MNECGVVRESVRSLTRDDREFVLRYSMTTRESREGPQCYIEASVCETAGKGSSTRSGCRVEMSHVHVDVVRRIFELIAGAEDPVFPVHVPEIVLDQLSAAALVAVKMSA